MKVFSILVICMQSGFETNVVLFDYAFNQSEFKEVKLYI